MLINIENKLKNALLENTTTEGFKTSISSILESIASYNKTNETLSSMHCAFKALDDYNVQYTTAVAEYNANENAKPDILVLKVQKILCVATLAATLINEILKKYATSKDTGTMAKYLRLLNDQKDHFKSEKILWQSILKSLTALVGENTQRIALETKELEFRIKYHSVDKKE